MAGWAPSLDESASERLRLSSVHELKLFGVLRRNTVPWCQPAFILISQPNSDLFRMCELRMNGQAKGFCEPLQDQLAPRGRSLNDLMGAVPTFVSHLRPGLRRLEHHPVLEE